MTLSRLKKYLALACKKSFLPAFFLFAACVFGGYIDALNGDGVDLSMENVERLLTSFPFAYLCAYIFVFCSMMWNYYINDGFVKDEEIT